MVCTDNPLYTDTRYNDKICYNDKSTIMNNTKMTEASASETHR